MAREPSLAELLRTAIESRLADVHTSLPGRVKTYNPATQKADIEIVLRRAETGASGATVHETYPVIPNVPIAWPRGGGYSMQFPLSVGDHVWLSFSESCMAQWRVSGDLSIPGDLRRHDLSYPIAIPCIAPDAETLPSAAGGALVTTPAGGALSVSEAGGAPEPVAIASKVMANLNALKTALTSATYVNSGGTPTTLVISPAIMLEDVGSENLKAE